MEQAKDIYSINQGQNMLFVSSGNLGGVGKTWFAVTLAHALSLLGKKTLLFDGDFGLENVYTQLGLKGGVDLYNVLTGAKTLNQAVLHYDKKKLDIIYSQTNLGGLNSLPVGNLQILGSDLSLLAASYDKVIIDIGTGLKNAAKVLFSYALGIIVLCTEERSSLTEGYELIKLIREKYANCQIFVVINMVKTFDDGRFAYGSLKKACEEYLSFTPKLLGVVRQDARIRDSIKNQMSVISRYPAAEATQDIITIAKKLVNNE